MDWTTARQVPERRMEPRLPLRKEAVLYCDAIGEPVVITNISSYGAMLAGRNFPVAGVYVTLAIAGRDLVATVAWRGVEKCGLLFHERIDPTTLPDAMAAAEHDRQRQETLTYI